MVSLTVVRHAQASYLSDNYDRLSLWASGRRRSWANTGLRRGTLSILSSPGRPNAMYARRRSSLPCSGALDKGWSQPAIVLNEFDEFPGRAGGAVAGTVLAGRREDIRMLADAFEALRRRPRSERRWTGCFTR